MSSTIVKQILVRSILTRVITSWLRGTRICLELYYLQKLKQLLDRIIISIVSLIISRYQDLLIHGGSI